MTGKNEKYWEKRAILREKRKNNRTEKYLRELKKQYNRALKDIQNELDSFYQKYAKENSITFGEANKKLSAAGFKEWQKKIEGYLQDPGKYTNELKDLLENKPISRLTALKANITASLQRLMLDEQQGIKDELKETCASAFMETMFDIQQGIGMGVSFALPDERVLEEIVQTPWSGKSFSKRIWGHTDKVIRQSRNVLSQAVLQGTSLSKAAARLADRMDVAYSNAARLIRTESNFAYNQGNLEAYKESGIERYKYLATLDKKTSRVCRQHDGKIYKLDEASVGNNYPPLHPNCRSTVTGYFPDIKSTAQRIARGLDGKNYYVPADMTYDEWYNKYVKDQVEAQQAQKKKDKELKKLQKLNSPVQKRHDIMKISGKSPTKNKNTVIMPDVDVEKDIEEIKKGNYVKSGAYYEVNQRKYGVHNTSFYPVEGEGLVLLDRGGYDAFKKYIELGDNPKVDQIFDKMGITEDNRQVGKKLWRVRQDAMEKRGNES